MGISELLGKSDKMLGGGGNLAMDWHPIQGGSSNPSRFILRKPG